MNFTLYYVSIMFSTFEIAIDETVPILILPRCHLFYGLIILPLPSFIPTSLHHLVIDFFPYAVLFIILKYISPLWRLFSVHVFIFILLDSNVLVSLPFRMYPSQIVQQSFIYSTELISHTILY